MVYGGTGKAARDWNTYDAIVRTLTTLKLDETLLVQSGRPVGVMQTHEWAPRVLIANSNLVGDWANWEEFRRLEQLGLTMYGQMTAGSWIYIGTQGILQGTYETFAAVAAKKFSGTLAGTITLTAGLGGMGGAQPLAVTMNDGVAICIDCDPTRIARRIEHRYLDVQARLAAGRARPGGRGPRCPQAPVHRPVGQRGVAGAGAAGRRRADRHRHRPDLGPRPAGLPADRGRLRRHEGLRGEAKPAEFTDRARESMARHVEAMVGFQDAGAEVFDYGNSIRGEAQLAGYAQGVRVPRLRPGLHPAAVLRGQGPVPVGGAVRRPEGHRPYRQGDSRPVPGERVAAPVDHDGPGAGALPGPAGPDLLARLRRAGQGRPGRSTTWSPAARSAPRS